jgi:hypothetical protein
VKTARLSWSLYIVGSLLVFGSWVDLVPTGLGWAGWLMALMGWAGESRPTRTGEAAAPISVAEQIERLDALQQRNVITADEFQIQKRRLLEPSTGEAQHLN